MFFELANRHDDDDDDDDDEGEAMGNAKCDGLRRKE